MWKSQKGEERRGHEHFNAKDMKQNEQKLYQREETDESVQLKIYQNVFH